jgi:hypothetical protein
MSYTPNSRGGFASRRGRGGWSKPFSKPSAKPKVYVKPDIERHPLGHLLNTIHNLDLKVDRTHQTDTATAFPAILDLQYIASYNWINDDTPTILVPGE